MDILNKSVVTSKKNLVKLILYFITLVILGLLIYYAYTSYIKYKNSGEVYDTEETLLMDDWVLGNTKVELTKQLPQSMIANEYSFTCLIYLNDLNELTKNENQLLLSKGDDDLRVEIPKIIENPLNNLKFHFKLQSQVEDDGAAAAGEDAGAGEDDGAEGDDAAAGDDEAEDGGEDADEAEDGGEDGGEGFSNTDINSNVVDYFTAQSIYPKELFSSITKETFATQEELEAITTVIDATTDNNTKALLSDMRDSYIKSEADKTNQLIYKNTASIELSNNTTKTVFHMGVVVYNNIIDIYLNSNLVSSKSLEGLPLINNKPFTFFPKGNFNGYVNKFTYFNKALNHDDINNNYRKYYNTSIDKIPFLT